jgi:hypothetical protein
MSGKNRIGTSGIESGGNTIVTRRLRQKTYCHHNFGYYSRKDLILWGVIRESIGSPYALESKLVYS